LLHIAAAAGKPEGLRLLLEAGILPQPQEVQLLAETLAKHSKGRDTVGCCGSEHWKWQQIAWHG
jgi:hypothetical protein